MLDEGREPPAPVLVLGLGNPILRDDGVGWRVVEAAERRWHDRMGAGVFPIGEVRFEQVALGGLALMETLVGCDRAILVDATQTPGGVPGTLYRLELDDLPTLNANAMHVNAVHDASLADALELGRRLGAHLPERIAVIAVEAENVLDFGEALSPRVAGCVDRAAEMVLAELDLILATLPPT